MVIHPSIVGRSLLQGARVVVGVVGEMATPCCMHALRFFIKKKKNADLLFEVGVKKMLVQSTHDVMPSRYNISGARLLTPLKVNTTVPRYSITNRQVNQ